MILHRTRFFLLLILLLITPVITVKIIWLLGSKKTKGTFAIESYESALDQIRSPYSLIYFYAGKDTIWFKGPSQLGIAEKTTVPVRYQPDNPSDAKLDSFNGIWTDTIIYGGVPLFFILIVFAHPDVIPYRSKVMLTGRKPFIRVVAPR